MTMASTEHGFVSDPASPLSLRLLLIVAALAELVDSASALPALFMDHTQIPGPGIGGAIILPTNSLKPPLALAAVGGGAVKRKRVSGGAPPPGRVLPRVVFPPSLKPPPPRLRLSRA